MNSWIDLHALWKIVVGALICGALLPAVFAIGLRALHLGAPPESAVASGAASPAAAERAVGGNPLGMVLAAICFAAVLAAIAWGIYLIVNAA